MADTTKSGSPREDFNPLTDYLSELQHQPLTDDDLEAESPMSSLEIDNQNSLDIYGITPPTNPREDRRNKEKVRSHKNKKATQEFKEFIEAQRREKLRDSKRQGIALENISDDMASCRLDDEEESLLNVSHSDRQMKRKDSSKSFKTSRSHDRDFKNSTSGELSMDIPSDRQVDMVRVLSSIKVDSPNRFFSLDSKQVPGLPGEQRTTKPPHVQRRQVSSQVTECPREREEFYRIFSQLITMGSEKKKDKEIFQRQLSSEQLVWQNKVNDLIWLELQAWARDVSIEEQDRYLCATRDDARNILNEIVEFQVYFDTTGCAMEGSTQDCNECQSLETEKVGSSHDPPNLSEVFQRHREAMRQVADVLDKLESVEKLYPTLKALGRDHPLYMTEDFQMRVNSLLVWFNISKELGHKLQLMAKVLYIDHISDFEWPWLDTEKPEVDNSETSCSTECLCAEDNQENGEEDTVDGGGRKDQDQGTCVDSGVGTFVDHVTIPSKSVRFDVGSPSTSSPSDSQNRHELPSLSNSSTVQRSVRSPTHVSHASSMSRSSSSMSVEELSQHNHSIYRYYADRTLKKTGLRKAMVSLKNMASKTLIRTKMVVEKPRGSGRVRQESVGSPDGHYSSTFRQFLQSSNLFKDHLDFAESETDFHEIFAHLQGKFCFEEIGLPSFRPIYLFFVRISLDVVHECLKLRLEQQPEEPSMLSVKQLIRECKEVLLASVMVKQYYLVMITDVVGESYEAELESFEEDFKKMLETYFKYIQSWMTGLMSSPEMSKRLKNVLEEEWNFTKLVCPHVRGGEANAGNWFCVMASSLLRSITDFMESGMDEEINSLYDTTMGDSYEDLEMLARRNSRSIEIRHAINKTCRNFKHLFHEARERASKALGFAKKLRKDLEIAADFNINVTAKELLDALKETGHVQVVAPQSSGYLMFIPEGIADNKTLVMQYLNVTCGREDSSHTPTDDEEGYLLLVKCAGAIDSRDHCPLWKGRKVLVDPTAETTIALSHIEVEGLLLIVTQSSLLYTQRKHFEQLVGPVVQLVHESTSCHQAIAESLQELKQAGLYLRERITDAIAQVDEKLALDDIAEMDEVEKASMQKLIRETLHQCYNFGFEYHKEVTRLVTGEARARVAGTLLAFAIQWMKFVSEKCERGRGIRPRWASQGLEFLIHACEPKVLATLTEEEFTELKSAINRCICHVIGEKGAGGGSPGPTGRRVASPDVRAQRHVLRNVSCPGEPRHRSPSTRSTQSEPGIHHSVSSSSNLSSSPGGGHSPEVGPLSPGGTRRRWSRPRVEVLEGEAGIIMEVVDSGSEGQSPEDGPGRKMDRINRALATLEKKQNDYLVSNEVIGKVTERKVEIDYRLNIRRVNFKWQRGIKVGEGQFGKVYTAVNTDTGDLMAMKELRFQPNDYQAVKDIADEIMILAELDHPTLIKYYGVEVHRDEMLLFMEYCSGGTLADAARHGLSEEIIRKYTHEVLVAISVLHDKQVVHRDIKGANIFLTPHGLKLGDFGCAVKLKNHTTLPGEFKNMAGTTAYMAPEVVTSNTQEGHGRAADIWSLGCVVIEMTTGKRPWHEFENNFMIMFRVGMGGSPSIPDTLSDEGQDFLDHCLEHDPRQRWTASELLGHPFVKVFQEDDGDANV